MDIARQGSAEKSNLMDPSARKKSAILLFGLITLVNCCRNFLWLIPASLMTPIMQDMGFNYTQVGQMSLVPTVMMGMFLIGGSYILERVGASRAMAIGTLCIALDGLCTYLGGGFSLIIFGKVLFGIGYGLTTCSFSALIALTFPRERLGIANGLNVCIASVSITLAYQFIVPIFERIQSWKMEALIWGIVSFIVVVLIALWQRFYGAPSPSKGADLPKTAVQPNVSTAKQQNNLRLALEFSAVRKFILMFSSMILIYVSVNSYYPNYLHKILNFSLARAASMTGLVAIAGMVGSLLIGFVSTRIKRPKVAILIILGLLVAAFVGMMSFTHVGLLLISVCCFGAGYFSLMSFASTCIMHLPGISPFVASAGIAMMNAFGSLLALLIPTLHQMMVNRFDLRTALFAFGILLVPAFFGAVRLPPLSWSEKA